MQRDSEEDVPSGTLFYIDVADLEQTRRRVREAGGEILVEEMAVPEMGVFTIFRDPGGITEAAWETRLEGAEQGEDSPVFTDDPDAGSITHFEFYSDDTEASRSFHEAVFGWTFESIDDDAYTMIRPPTPPTGGLLPATPELPTGTLVYLLVDDAEASCSTIEEAGGRILREPFDVDGWGIMAVCEAPGNVVLAVWESAPESTERQPAGESTVIPEGQH